MISLRPHKESSVVKIYREKPIEFKYKETPIIRSELSRINNTKAYFSVNWEFLNNALEGSPIAKQKFADKFKLFLLLENFNLSTKSAIVIAARVSGH